MTQNPTYGNPAINPYRQYLVNKVETASPLMLIIMLYDECIKMCEQAKADIGKNKESVHNKLIKAQKIITELTVSLNMDQGGEVAENLKALYVYLHMRLVEANIENNASKIDEALRIMRELREAWHTVNQENRKLMLQQGGGLNTYT
jgi:flagellar protein FliS